MRQLAIAFLAWVLTVVPAAAQQGPVHTPGPGERGYLPLQPPDHAALDQGILILVPGRTAVVGVDGKNDMTLVSEKPAADTDDKPAQGQLAFTLKPNGSGGMMLSVQSGLDRPVAYVAVISMLINGKRALDPTTICAVRPGVAGVEGWPEPLDIVQVVQIVNAPAGTCLDPKSQRLYKEGEQPPSAGEPKAAPAPGAAI